MLTRRLYNRQDLNCSVLAGSTRVVDHTTFPELDWQRDAHSLVNFAIPEGFSGISHLVQDEFLKVLQDVNALQRIRDSTFFSPEEEISMTQIDNHQASIQSRIVSLRSFSSVHSCCYLAVYLCSTMLRCRRWRTSTVPVSQLPSLSYEPPMPPLTHTLCTDLFEVTIVIAAASRTREIKHESSVGSAPRIAYLDASSWWILCPFGAVAL